MLVDTLERVAFFYLEEHLSQLFHRCLLLHMEGMPALFPGRGMMPAPMVGMDTRSNYLPHIRVEWYTVHNQLVVVQYDMRRYTNNSYWRDIQFHS